jgi:hypothetical protein
MSQYKVIINSILKFKKIIPIGRKDKFYYFI